MTLTVIVGFVFGLVLGSFTKVLADRSLTDQSFNGRSYCPNCKKALRWYDLFPILSYLSTGGKCRYCHKKISLSYPLVEILTGALVALAFYYNFNFGLEAWTSLFNLTLDPAKTLALLDTIFKSFAICVLVAVFLTDIETGYIPDRITIRASILALGYLVLNGIYRIYLTYQSIVESLVGKYLLPPHSDYFTRHAMMNLDPLFGGLIAALVIGLFFGGLIFFTKGRGMGGGDFKLGIFIGLVLGIQNSLVAILLAFLSGSVVGIALLLAKKKNFGQTIPFGPFMSFGAIVALFWGQQIFDWYLHLRLF